MIVRDSHGDVEDPNESSFVNKAYITNVSFACLRLWKPKRMAVREGAELLGVYPCSFAHCHKGERYGYHGRLDNRR